MSTTYYAATAMQIQQARFAAGDTIGSGDIDPVKQTGTFTPAAKAKGAVELGHVIPRLLDGRIVTKQPEQPAPEFPAKKKPASKSGPSSRK